MTVMWGAASAEPSTQTGPSASGSPSVPSAAAEGQVSLVEDFAYPGAEEIVRRRDIRLVSGDGRITLVGCGGPGLIEVRRSGARKDTDPDRGHYCFRATGGSGRLVLEVPDTFQIKGDGHEVDATVRVDGATSKVDVDSGRWTGVGRGVGANPAVLLELRTSTG
nr:hypothetical protein GCM10017745_47800 [Saccharothrix mutabilis subsp. capreolus]